MSLIAVNQTVSRQQYDRYIADECGLPVEFLASKAIRIAKAYEMGEPIGMICDEIKMLYRLNAGRMAQKSARSLAVRVVKF